MLGQADKAVLLGGGHPGLLVGHVPHDLGL